MPAPHGAHPPINAMFFSGARGYAFELWKIAYSTLGKECMDHSLALFGLH